MIQAARTGTAVITGAAGGFGQCFARTLAARGYDLLLIDRRPAELNDVKLQLEAEYDVQVDSRVVDLTDDADVEALAQLLARDPSIEMLVNNAGFANLKQYIEIAPEKHEQMIALHVTAPNRLIRAVLPNLIEKRQGAIVNVSSLGAWLPSGDAQYTATKAYLLVLAQALHQELKGTGVRVQALCPSFVDTGFHNTQEMNRFPRASIPASLWMTPEQVIQCCFQGLERNRAIVIPGWRNRIISIGLRSPWIGYLIRQFVQPGKPSGQQVLSDEPSLSESIQTTESAA